MIIASMNRYFLNLLYILTWDFISLTQYSNSCHINNVFDNLSWFMGV